MRANKRANRVYVLFVLTSPHPEAPSGELLRVAAFDSADPERVRILLAEGTGALQLQLELMRRISDLIERAVDLLRDRLSHFARIRASDANSRPAAIWRREHPAAAQANAR
jgi:hypothetical protein